MIAAVDLSRMTPQNYAIAAGIVFLSIFALLLVWHLTKAVVKTGLILSALALIAFALWWLYNHFDPALPTS